MNGWYYLHTNGKLIFKRFEPDPSDFVKHVWPIDTSDRADAWRIILEGLHFGASVERVKELAAKWGCDALDLLKYLVRNINPNHEMKLGLELYLSKIIGVDPDAWFDWLEGTPKGEAPDWDSMPKGSTDEILSI